jgi:hypothetical protein
MIAEGLQGGERVVAEGVLKARPGVKVKVAAPASQPPPPAKAGATQ